MKRSLTTKEHVRQIVEDVESVPGRIFDLIVYFLIVLTMIAMAVETLPDLSESTRKWLQFAEDLTLGLFVFEYLLRIWVAEKPIKYLFSFFGLVDLLSILPSLFVLTFDSRALRSLRLIRIVRVLKMARYSSALRRLHLALVLAWEEIVLFFGTSLLMLFIAAVGIYQLEHEAQPEAFASIPHAMWWAVATLTTVGYGDVYPITAGGKIFTFLVLVVGLGVVAMPAGLIASALTKARSLEATQQESDCENEDLLVEY